MSYQILSGNCLDHLRRLPGPVRGPHPEASQVPGIRPAPQETPPHHPQTPAASVSVTRIRIMWIKSHRADSSVVPLADRHYNRQKIGSPQFAPPGRCLVLKTKEVDAFWITSWPFGEYVKHEWAGAWVCSAFRNESKHLSSDLIREAVACTLAYYGPSPAEGMITFVDTSKVRKKRDFGRCYRRAGFLECGFTKGGLLALHLAAENMPQPKTGFPQHKSIRINQRRLFAAETE